MAINGESLISEMLSTREAELLDSWMSTQLSAESMRPDLISEGELRGQSAEFLRRFQTAVARGGLRRTDGPQWDEVRELLASFSRSRALQGFSPTETAVFVLSLKQPLFNTLRRELADHPEELLGYIWTVTTALDRLGLFTTEAYLRSREDVIRRQHQELLELSTPVVKLWEGVVAVPLIGTLDSARTQVVMENLLQRIVDTSARIAIIDITGVPTVDTLVAQHLIKTVAAARLMGADCIISGIRPQIAQTIVHLGVVLEDVVTKATLADAIALALGRTGYEVARIQKRG